MKYEPLISLAKSAVYGFIYEEKQEWFWFLSVLNQHSNKAIFKATKIKMSVNAFWC